MESKTINRTKMVGAIVALTASAAFAQTETLTVSASASGPAGSTSAGGNPGAQYIADLEQFDASLGTLTSVGLTISGYHEGTFDFLSNGPGGGYIILYIDYSFEVNGFGGTGGNLLFLDWVTEPTEDDPFGSGPGHFNTDLVFVDEGVPATETFGTQLDYANTFTAGDAEFSQFIGDGTLAFDIVDWAVFSIATLGQDVSWELSSTAGISVEATYTYIVPSSGVLPVLAVSGLLTSRRRRSV